MMNALTSVAWWEVFLGGVSTLAIFSFLYRENGFYRIFEHLFIGISAAVGIMAFVQTFIWPEIIKPLFGLDVVVFPDGTSPEPYNRANLLMLFPIAFGLLYYSILSRKHAWVAQVVIGFSLGVGAGNAFKATFNEMLPQLKDSFRPLILPESVAGSLSNIVFTASLLCAMSYFFFTFRRKPGGLGSRSALLGRWLMMCCFGAFFGATIMARMALLVERLQFLIDRWWPAIDGAVRGTWIG